MYWVDVFQKKIIFESNWRRRRRAAGAVALTKKIPTKRIKESQILLFANKNNWTTAVQIFVACTVLT